MTYMHYGEPQYWDVRYQDEQATSSSGFENFDWFITFKDAYSTFESVINDREKSNILVVGVGKSDVIDVLYKKGFREIVSIDISPTIINQMKAQYKDYVGVEFFVMDVRELNLIQDQSFSIIIDKGCYDAGFCSVDMYENSERWCSEIYRVMKDEGVCCLFSHASLPSRIPYLRYKSWAIDVFPITLGDTLNMYALTRTTNVERVGRKFPGAEIVNPEEVVSKSVVSSIDQTQNKVSRTKTAANSGSVTVTSSIEILAKMVADNEESEGK